MNMLRINYSVVGMGRKSNKSQSGSSLLQTSITLMLAGVFVGVSLSFITPVAREKPKLDTYAQQENILDAFSTFVERNGRLPCPTSLSAVMGDPLYGRENCTLPTSDTGRDDRLVITGGLPVRSLDLPDSYMLDGYKKQYIYAVTALLTEQPTFSNEEGGIYIKDETDTDLTTFPGTALYTVVSTGKYGSTQNCNLTQGDGENCNGDALFSALPLNINNKSLSHFDDILIFSEQEPRNPYALCGSRGRVYAPSQAASDEDGCLKVMDYKKHKNIVIMDEHNVNCTSSGAYCDGEWFDLTTLNEGDYVIHWSGFIQFSYPQSGQYAVLEFKTEDEIQSSHSIPFNSSLCSAAPELKAQTGVVQIPVKSSQTLQGRIRLFGGSYSGAECGGNASSVKLALGGAGDTESTKSLSLNILTRYGQATTDEQQGSGTTFDEEDVIAIAESVDGTVTVSHSDGTIESVSDGFGFKQEDQIETASESSLTVAFEDGTNVDIDEETIFIIDDYEFDEESGEGAGTFSMPRGILSYFGGLIDDGDDSSINTPVGSIGIRGTAFMLRHEPGGIPPATGMNAGLMSVMLLECCVDVFHMGFDWTETERDEVFANMNSAGTADTSLRTQLSDKSMFVQTLDQPYDLAHVQSGQTEERLDIAESEVLNKLDEFVAVKNEDPQFNPFISTLPSTTSSIETQERLEHMATNISDESQINIKEKMRNRISEINQGRGTEHLLLRDLEAIERAPNVRRGTEGTDEVSPDTDRTETDGADEPTDVRGDDDASIEEGGLTPVLTPLPVREIEPVRTKARYKRVFRCEWRWGLPPFSCRRVRVRVE